jgi:hypothetical protein
VGGGTLPKTSSRKTFLNFRNGFAMLYKNIAPDQFYRVIPLRLLLDWVAAIKFMTDGDFKSTLAVFKAHADCWRHRRYWRAQRRRQQAWQQPLTGVYPGSVVWDYFIGGKKHYGELEIPDRAPLPAQAFADIKPESQHQVNDNGRPKS